jgi:hypothetical protein
MPNSIGNSGSISIFGSLLDFGDNLGGNSMSNFIDNSVENLNLKSEPN